MKIRVLICLSVFFMALTIVSAQDPTIYNNCEIYGNCVPEGAWVTSSLGTATDANATQFIIEEGVFNILESWIDSLWCRLTGCTMEGPLDMDGNDIVDAGEISAVNISASGIISGQPIDGGIGVGLIESTNLTSGFNLKVIHDHIGSPGDVTYGRGYYRGINPTTGIVFYCNISEDTVTPTSNATSIYYIDENCAVQITTWSDFSSSSKLFYPWMIAVMKHGDEIEFHYQTTLMNHQTSKDDNIYFTFESLTINEGYGLTLGDFTNLTIGSGSYQFVRDIAQTTTQNTTDGADVEVIAYAGGTPDIVEVDGGLDLTNCDDGGITPCTTTALWRRTLIGMVGQQINGDDNSEIHQVLPQQSETFSNIGNCENLVDSPVGDSFTLPSYYQGVFVTLYMYCYKPNANDWTGAFIDLRSSGGIGGSGGSIDTSAFVQKAGDTMTGNLDGDDNNLTGWDYVVANVFQFATGEALRVVGGILQVPMDVNFQNKNLNNVNIAGDFSWTGDDVDLDIADTEKTILLGTTGELRIRGLGGNWLELDVASNTLAFGNGIVNPDYLFLGSGTVDVEGSVEATKFTSTAASGVPAFGFGGNNKAEFIWSESGTLDTVSLEVDGDLVQDWNQLGGSEWSNIYGELTIAPEGVEKIRLTRDGNVNASLGIGYFDRLVLGQDNESVNLTLNISSGDAVVNTLYANAVEGRSPFMINPDHEVGYTRMCVYDMVGVWNMVWWDRGITQTETNNLRCSAKFLILQQGREADLIRINEEKEQRFILQQEIKDCIDDGYDYDRQGCFEIVKVSVTRNEAVETYQKEIMQLVNVTFEKFDREFNVIEVTEEEEVGTGRFEDAWRLKDGCGLERGFGLYCEVRELR